MLPTLNLRCSFIILIETRNNQQPICDIALLHVTNHSFHGFPSSTVNNSGGNRGINMT